MLQSRNINKERFSQSMEHLHTLTRDVCRHRLKKVAVHSGVDHRNVFFRIAGIFEEVFFGVFAHGNDVIRIADHRRNHFPIEQHARRIVFGIHRKCRQIMNRGHNFRTFNQRNTPCGRDVHHIVFFSEAWKNSVMPCQIEQGLTYYGGDLRLFKMRVCKRNQVRVAFCHQQIIGVFQVLQLEKTQQFPDIGRNTRLPPIQHKC